MPCHLPALGRWQHPILPGRSRSAGRNPLVALRAAQELDQAKRQAAATADQRTFGSVAETLLTNKELGWRNSKHRAQWRMTLNVYAASIWNRPVDEISADHVLACLQPIWLEKPETASRTRGRIEAVLNAARARGFISADRANPARWRGHLDHLLARPAKLSRGHHAAMPWQEVPQFTARLRERQAVAAFALEFIILTATRSGEGRGARWVEFGLEAAIWTIPASRMKAGVAHRVPLSARVLQMVRQMASQKSGDLVFPGAKLGKPLSDMAFVALFERMGSTGITTHGFRSSFRDWAGEATRFPRELAEEALAHAVGNRVERAYRRGDSLERRRVMMETWASFCEHREGVVVPMVRAGSAMSHT